MKVYLLYIEESLCGVFESKDAAEQRAIKARIPEDDEGENRFQIIEEEVQTLLDNNLDPYHIWLWRDGTVRDAHISDKPIYEGLEPGNEWVKLVRINNKNHQYSFLDVLLWSRSKDEAITIGRAWVSRYIEQGKWKI